MHSGWNKGVKMKDTGLRIRVDDELRSAFIHACKNDDLTAAQVIRSFMRAFVARQHSGETQPDLFKKPSMTSRQPESLEND